MRETDAAEPNQALGAPIKKPVPEPMAPRWKPVSGHPEHETDGKDIRLKPAGPNKT